METTGDSKYTFADNVSIKITIHGRNCIVDGYLTDELPTQLRIENYKVPYGDVRFQQKSIKAEGSDENIQLTFDSETQKEIIRQVFYQVFEMLNPFHKIFNRAYKYQHPKLIN